MLVLHAHAQESVQCCLQAGLALHITCLLHALLHIRLTSISLSSLAGLASCSCQLLVMVLLFPAGLLPEGVLGPPPQAAPGVHRHAQEAGKQRHSTSGPSVPGAVSACNGT